MDQKLPAVQPRGVPLQEAWYTFASPSLRTKISDRRVEPLPVSSATTLEQFQYMARGLSVMREIQEAKIQAADELRLSLAEGDRVATGLPPPSGGRFQRVLIEAAFWDAAKLDIVKGSASAMGVEYAAVQVFDASAVQVERPTQAQSQLPSQFVAQPSDLPAAAGATSYEDIRAEAILYCFRTYRNFEKIRLDRRLQMVVDYVDTNHPEINVAWGFDRSSFYSTVRRLRETGQLPSNNVQE